MSLDRTATTVRLRSTDGLHYTVRMVDEGDGVVIPEADNTTGSAQSSDAHVALLGDDEQVYRWSLRTNAEDPTIIEHDVRLSPNQAESYLPGVDLQFSESWLRVSVELQLDGDGNPVPTLVVGPGTPFVEVVTDDWATQLFFAKEMQELFRVEEKQELLFAS